MPSPSYEKSLFTIRFIGDGLDLHGVSIYDLGVMLVTFQRLVNKTFLLTRHRLEKGAFPKKAERQALALQVGARKKQSDGYGLIPVLMDASNLQILKFVGEQLFAGLSGYYVQDVMRRLKAEKDDDKRFYIGSIHADVVNIIHRIDAAGNVGAIEIGSPALSQPLKICFDQRTKEYVKKISKESFLGAKQVIRGKMLKLVPSSALIEIRRAGGGVVKVRVDLQLFDRVRFDQSGSDTLEFTGYPIYPLGATSKKIHEFQAIDVEVIESDGV